uniref:ARAD1C01034p n=1 Tax=Blastobotrys adeninivorans TaxID=409370 RepID=A0A060SYY5_BLAAD
MESQQGEPIVDEQPKEQGTTEPANGATDVTMKGQLTESVAGSGAEPNTESTDRSPQDAPNPASSTGTGPVETMRPSDSHEVKQEKEAEQVSSTVITEDPVAGAPTRQWLNAEVTPVLLQGMRKIAVERPQNPLKALGQYLIDHS